MHACRAATGGRREHPLRVVALLAAVACAGALSSSVEALPAAGDRPPPYRYMFHSGSNQRGAAALGFNLLDVDAKGEADALPPGARGLYLARRLSQCADVRLGEARRAGRGEGARREGRPQGLGLLLLERA